MSAMATETAGQGLGESLFPAGYTTGFGAGGQSIVQAGQRLSANPQLVGANVQGDDIYAAALANARFQTNQQYQNILRELGFMTQAGQFIPGLIETEAVRKRQELATGLENATRLVNEAALKGGSYFSGRRVQNLATQQQPFTTGMAQLEGSTMQALMNKYNEAAGLLSGFGITQQQLLGELAERRKQAAWQQQYLDALRNSGNDGGGGGGGGGGPAAAPVGGHTVVGKDAEGRDIVSAPIPGGGTAIFSPNSHGYVPWQNDPAIAAQMQKTNKPGTPGFRPF